MLLARVSSRLVCTSVARARGATLFVWTWPRRGNSCGACGDLRGGAIERWKSRRLEESRGQRERRYRSRGFVSRGETCLPAKRVAGTTRETKRNLSRFSVAREMETVFDATRVAFSRNRTTPRGQTFANVCKRIARTEAATKGD